jgi:sulfonate transport system ATP-binding protein
MISENARGDADKKMNELHIDIRSKFYRSSHGNWASEPVIRNLQLSARAGEFVCLVGPSGCGKTTLLNILAGVDREFEGGLTFGSTDQAPRLGYVFQSPRLLPWRSVEENITLALPADHDQAYIDHLFSVVGLAPSRHLFPERLSLGMSRRVALVRAFAINPDLLLMDEPFVSLDPPTARRIRQLLVSLWVERPHTVMFVTHDLREAIELADRLVFLSHSPTRVIGEIEVTTPRHERDDAFIDQFKKGIGTRHATIAALL